MVNSAQTSFLPVSDALVASGWTYDDAARALELGVVGRRFRSGTWQLSERDAALLLLARDAAALVGAQPTLRTLSLWRSALSDPLCEDMLVVSGAQEVQVGAQALMSALETGRPALAVSTAALVRALRARLAEMPM